MKSAPKMLILLLFPIIAGGLACTGQSSPGTEEADNFGGKKISLESIYSTSRQKGLKLIDRGHGDDGFRVEMGRLYERSVQTGASDIFLARGDDIAAVVKATWRGGTAGTGLVEDERSKSDKYWLVAHLGVGRSDPPAWFVESVQITKRPCGSSSRSMAQRRIRACPQITFSTSGSLQ